MCEQIFIGGFSMAFVLSICTCNEFSHATKNSIRNIWTHFFYFHFRLLFIHFLFFCIYFVWYCFFCKCTSAVNGKHHHLILFLRERERERKALHTTLLLNAINVATYSDGNTKTIEHCLRLFPSFDSVVMCPLWRCKLWKYARMQTAHNNRYKIKGKKSIISTYHCISFIIHSEKLLVKLVKLKLNIEYSARWGTAFNTITRDLDHQFQSIFQCHCI